jgi:AcrR family transcriptional regulator
MAQFKKEEVRQSLLRAARREFLEHGFMKANMRSIAQRAGQNLGNIYNYFKNKDALFQAVLEKTLLSIDQAIQFITSWQPSDSQPIYSMEDERQAILAVIDYVTANRDDVILLAFKSQGSSLEQLKETLLREMTQVFNTVMKQVVDYNKDEFKNMPSEFFIASLMNYFTNTLLEAVRQEMTRDEMHEMAEEMLIYYYSGLMALLKRE